MVGDEATSDAGKMDMMWTRLGSGVLGPGFRLDVLPCSFQEFPFFSSHTAQS